MNGTISTITPRKSGFKRFYLNTLLWFVGRAIAAASRVDKNVKEEFRKLPDDFTFSMGVHGGGPNMVVGKNSRGRVRYMGRKAKAKPTLIMEIKSLEAAMLLFTFKEGTCVSQSRDRILADGPVPAACAVVRIINMVEIYLLPRAIAKKAVKRYASPKLKHLNRIRIYTRTLLGL